MDVVNFRELDEILKEEGYRIKTAHDIFPYVWVHGLFEKVWEEMEV